MAIPAVPLGLLLTHLWCPEKIFIIAISKASGCLVLAWHLLMSLADLLSAFPALMHENAVIA